MCSHTSAKQAGRLHICRMPWSETERLHIVGQWPGKVHISNGRPHWEWQYVFDNMGYVGPCNRFWKNNKKHVRKLIGDFSLDASTDILRGKRFYESQKAIQSQAADAPAVDLISTRFLWSTLVATMCVGKQERKTSIEGYFTFLLNNVCRDQVELPLVFRTSDGFCHVTLTLFAPNKDEPGGLDMSPVQNCEECPLREFLSDDFFTARVPLLRVLVAIRHGANISLGTTLQSTLYCMLDPLVRLTDTWVLATGVPVREIRHASQLMPRPMVCKRRRNIDPDTKRFLGWGIFKHKAARERGVFLKAHAGAQWGPPAYNSSGNSEKAISNAYYAHELARRMDGLKIIALSIDEVTLDGRSHFVPIITDPKTKTTGYGSIQVWLG